MDLEIDGWNKDLTPSRQFDKITSKKYKVYIPIYSNEEHWTLAVFTRVKIRVEFYYTIKSCVRARHVQSAFRAIINRALPPGTELSFTERVGLNSGLITDGLYILIKSIFSQLLNRGIIWTVVR
jgi:hypothetical protein